jgi:hypothetical protein
MDQQLIGQPLYHAKLGISLLRIQLEDIQLVSLGLNGI